MGYTTYWHQSRGFTQIEWKFILGETKRIIAKAARGEYYTGKEDAASQDNVTLNEKGFRTGFNESGAWRTFPHPEAPIPCRGEPILVAGPAGTGKPRLTKRIISLNGKQPDNYETFLLEKDPQLPAPDGGGTRAHFAFCKTEYRKYDAVIVSILAAARTVAPDAITVTSDGGPSVIRYLF